MSFLQVKGNGFARDGKEMMLRGWALGSWMNLEHFMVGLPGTNEQILGAIREVFGNENAEVFLDRFLDKMVGKEDLCYLKSLGINTVRIPIGYHHFLDDADPDHFLESGFRRLNRVVEECARQGLYVILDLHSAPGGQNPDWHSDNLTGQPLFWKYRVFQDQVISLWAELARRYADQTAIAGYDVLNEPGYGLTKEQINGFYDRVIAAIRNVDPHHILFLEGTDFGRDFSLLKKREDPNIAYTVHFYPFVLDTDILDPELDDDRRMKIFTGIFEKQLSGTARLGRPVWCGESGYELLDGMEDFYSMLILHNIQLCEERNISWNLWTYKDARCMGIVIPRKDSAWIRMTEEIRKKWSHHREEKISMEVTRAIGEKYYEPLTENMAYDLDFRIRAVLHEIAVEQVLKPYLRTVSFTDLLAACDDFAFSNCDRREQITEDIQNNILSRA